MDRPQTPQQPRPAPVVYDNQPDDPENGAPAAVDLRLLATSDLHMQLLAFDYFTRTPVPYGLELLAGLIARCRDGVSVGNSLLFDNGDLLHGNPLADRVAAMTETQGRHPAIASLNALGCDAAGLGNHDFTFGARFLGRTLAAARFPVVMANARLPSLAGRVVPWAILARQVLDRDGVVRALRVGVTGFIPPQTAAWEAATAPGLVTEDMLQAAQRVVGQMRAAGADLVVALVHGGLGSGQDPPGSENAAAAIAAVPGIDAVVAGHVHEVLPPVGTVAAGIPGGSAPVVMPGFGGSHLGVIDLTLRRGAAGWQIAASSARCLPAPVTVTSGDRAAAAMVRRAALPLHEATLAHARRPVGRSTVRLSSHLVMLGVDPGLRLVAMAQRWHLRRLLDGTRWAGLPILVATAPFRAGGRGGPTHFTDIPAGRLTRGDLAALYAFGNQPMAVEISGAELADWLERAAAAFHQIVPGVADQPLLREDFPAYNFDLIDGLHWQIDLAQPARYGASGLAAPAPAPAGAGRVTGLIAAGAPVTPNARFILATTDYRLSGAGLYASMIENLPRLPVAGPALREVIADYLRRNRQVAPQVAPVFSLRRIPAASAVLLTAPAATEALPAGLPLTPLGLDRAGFLRLRLDMDCSAAD